MEASEVRARRLPVEALGLEFHALRHLADGIEAERAQLPERAARDETAYVLTADQWNVFAEFLPEQLDQLPSMVALFNRHLGKYVRGCGILITQAFRDIGINAAVLLLVGDGQRQDFLFRQV